MLTPTEASQEIRKRILWNTESSYTEEDRQADKCSLALFNFMERASKVSGVLSEVQ